MVDTGMGHYFAIIGGDIYTLDTQAEVAEAARALRECEPEHGSTEVYRGGPEHSELSAVRLFRSGRMFAFKQKLGLS